MLRKSIPLALNHRSKLAQGTSVRMNGKKGKWTAKESEIQFGDGLGVVIQWPALDKGGEIREVIVTLDDVMEVGSGLPAPVL
jgi:hypothetical protein